MSDPTGILCIPGLNRNCDSRKRAHICFNCPVLASGMFIPIYTFTEFYNFMNGFFSRLSFLHIDKISPGVDTFRLVNYKIKMTISPVPNHEMHRGRFPGCVRVPVAFAPQRENLIVLVIRGRLDVQLDPVTVRGTPFSKTTTKPSLKPVREFVTETHRKIIILSVLETL